MNPYEPPIEAELVPQKHTTNPLLELVWKVVILILVATCFLVAYSLWMVA